MASPTSAAPRRGVTLTEEFEAMVAPHRSGVHGHCYRMLGTLADADDALQETLVRAWRGLGQFEGRSSIRTWLYRISTNVCLTMIDRRRPHVLPMDVSAPSTFADAEWVTGGEWLDPYPTFDRQGPEQSAERRESIELAFLAAIQHLSAAQRAVLVLREVLHFSAQEVAGMLDTTVAAVNSSLQRARRDLRARLPTAERQPERPELDDRVRALARSYVDAWELGDLDAVIGLLADDVTFQMPPLRVWFEGRDVIAEFLPEGPLQDRWRLLPTWANGQLAFACYAADRETGVFAAHSIDVVGIRGGRISSITAFLRAELVARFDLPPVLDARAQRSAGPAGSGGPVAGGR